MSASAARTAGVIFLSAALLAGCADRYSSLPGFLRKSEAEPPPPEPDPDVHFIVGSAIDSFFTSKPSAVAVSAARRNPDGRSFTVCLKAIVTGMVSNTPQGVTYVIEIAHGRIITRRRAEPDDGCEAEKYEPV